MPGKEVTFNSPLLRNAQWVIMQTGATKKNKKIPKSPS
jgi:hypothetical protein